MASKPTGNPVGAPITKPFKPEYCQMLIQWMAQGNTFTSFAGQCGVGCQQLYNWLHHYPEFAEAKELAQPLLERFMMDMGKMIATGQLRRLKKETPTIGPDGLPVCDMHGNAVYEREYEPAQGNVAAWICLSRNMLDNWRDRAPVVMHLPAPKPPEQSVGGGLPALETQYAHLTEAEVEARYNQLMEKALAVAGKKRKDART